VRRLSGFGGAVARHLILHLARPWFGRDWRHRPPTTQSGGRHGSGLIQVVLRVAPRLALLLVCRRPWPPDDLHEALARLCGAPLQDGEIGLTSAPKLAGAVARVGDQPIEAGGCCVGPGVCQFRLLGAGMIGSPRAFTVLTCLGSESRACGWPTCDWLGAGFRAVGCSRALGCASWGLITWRLPPGRGQVDDLLALEEPTCPNAGVGVRVKVRLHWARA